MEEEQQQEEERPRSVMWRATSGGHQQRQLQPRVLVLDHKGNYSPHAYAASSLRTAATPAPPHHPQSGASVLWYAYPFTVSLEARASRGGDNSPARVCVCLVCVPCVVCVVCRVLCA